MMTSEAKELIEDDTYSCVVAKENEIIYKGEGIGIRPLLNIYLNNKEALEGSFVADKVIGKAAATIIICGKVKCAYGKLMSKSAIELLSKNRVEFEYKELVEKIYNKDKSDICPLEKTVSTYDNPKDGLSAIFKFLKL